MMLNNDMEKRWVNGTIAEIIEIRHDYYYEYIYDTTLDKYTKEQVL